MVNNSTNINKNHLSPKLIEWWSTIPPISTKITSHFNSLNDGQQFNQYQQKSPLTSTHWVMVNNSTNINKNTPLTITHWVIVNNSTNINNNHFSPQLIKWWSTIPPPISTKITPLFNSLSDGQQFHQYEQKSPLTLTHWVIVNNSTNINNNHFSPQLIKWWSTIPPISTKITSHLITLSDGQQFHQYQQKSPLTLTHWVMVNNSTNINKNHLSLQLIEWWSTIPPISTTMTSHLNSLSDGQQFHQYNHKSPLTSTHWVIVNNSTNITTNHLSLQLIEWWSTIPPISTKITSHFNSLSDGQQFHQYQQKSPLTITHWVMVNNSTNINNNHLSPQLIKWWSTIPPISTKITLNSLSDGQQFHQYQQKSPLTSTHWVMVNNSTNINKNHLSPQLIEWWSTIPPISTKITSHLNSLSDVNNYTNINKNHPSHFNSLSDGQQFHQYQQKSPLT